MENFKVVRLVFAVMLAFVTASTFAAEFNDSNLNLNDMKYNIYLGGDAIKSYNKMSYVHAKVKADNIFVSNTNQYSAFIGTKLFGFFGVEIGYSYQPNKTRNSEYSNVVNHKTESKFKARHKYFGVFFDGAIVKDINMSIFFAGSSSGIKNTLIVKTDFGTPIENKEFKQTKLVPMVRFTFSKDFHDKWGVRLSGTWRQMSRFKFEYSAANGERKRIFKDSYSAGIGVYFYPFSKKG